MGCGKFSGQSKHKLSVHNLWASRNRKNCDIGRMCPPGTFLPPPPLLSYTMLWILPERVHFLLNSMVPFLHNIVLVIFKKSSTRSWLYVRKMTVHHCLLSVSFLEAHQNLMNNQQYSLMLSMITSLWLANMRSSILRQNFKIRGLQNKPPLSPVLALLACSLVPQSSHNISDSPDRPVMRSLWVQSIYYE